MKLSLPHTTYQEIVLSPADIIALNFMLLEGVTGSRHTAVKWTRARFDLEFLPAIKLVEMYEHELQTR